MRELRWYLEGFLDYPFPPETVHAEQVLDALKSWGRDAFNALFDRRDGGEWLAKTDIIQISSDDASVLSWPWEALYDPRAGTYLAPRYRIERRLNQLEDPPAPGDLPKDRVNILMVVARPYRNDVRYRSIARPLVELIHSKHLPASVDILRPPTFEQLRADLHARPNYYHVIHFDGHGGYGEAGVHVDRSHHQYQGSQGHLIFENDLGEADPKSANDLSVLLHEHAAPTVVLNACQAAMLDEKAEDAFASVATALLQGGMRSVVAMAYSLYVSGAQVFLPAFYGRLFESGSVADATLAGRQGMLSNKKRMSPRGPCELQDWLLPVLYQQAPMDFDFAKQAQVAVFESRLPRKLQEQRDEYGFIGRDGPILEMERALHRKAPCILIQGLGGVGKTTLARGFLRWLDQTGGLDGALWFDFREIRTAESVINQTGQAFYGENFGIANNKLQLLARALERVRVVMVWDNFESAAQNLPAEDRAELGRLLDTIRGTRGKVIMTSRSPEEWLKPSQRFEVRLGGLDGEERWEYCEVILRELGLKVNREDPQLKELMDQLRGHPLAMRAVLPKLERMTASRVAEALRNNISELDLSEKEEQGCLFATLRFVEQGLPEELQPLMNLVGLHESYLVADYLEAMAKQVDPAWIRARIDELTAALGVAGILRDMGNAIYEMHPLLTSYLRSKGEASETCQRAFIDVMASVADELAPRPLHEQRILFLLDGANFNFALRLSAKLGMNWPVAMLTQALAAYAQDTRDFVEALRLFHQLAEHSVAVGNPKGEARAYHHLGMIAAEQRDFARAREWYQKSLAIEEKQENEEGAARTYHYLGRIAQEQRDFASAREWYLKSLAISEKQGNEQWEASTYHQLGRIADEERDFARAGEWYLKSLAISEKQGNEHRAASTYHQLGVIAAEQGDFATAREWYLKSLAIKENQGDEHGAASTYHQLGRIAAEHRDFASAREWYQKSLAIEEKQGDETWAAITNAQIGVMELQQGNIEASGRCFVLAATLFLGASDPNSAQQVVGNFLITYQQASEADKQKLRTIWNEADLGPFPKYPSEAAQV
jgi:tetratricopeptide (TPR) repeat protein